MDISRNKDAASMCDERLKLSIEVTNAVQKNYAAKAAHDQAKDKTEARAALAVKLATARTAELAAVSALDKHRKEHGC